MPNVPMGHADFNRQVAREARVQTLNCYFEQNPVLNDQLSAMISRPALRYGFELGNGPVRAVYTSPGDFDEALFVVSGDSWYRLDLGGAITLLTDALNSNAAISMAATGDIGTTPEYLYLSDGRNLWLYTPNGFAHGILSGSPAVGDVVRLGSVYYQFTDGSVDAGAPAGTLANPYLVAHSLVDANSWQALAHAFGNTGTAGTDYSTGLVANADATAVNWSANAVAVRAIAPGTAGDSIPTTETGAGMAWSSITLEGGGQPSVTQVATPQDVGVISVAYISSYVVVIPVQGAGINGRFWWIEPGETTIDPLNFATAERAPDPIYQVVVFGDQFWLPGESTTEVWFFTGNLDSPVARVQGVTFDRGSWQGTAVQVKESMVIVDSDGGVFQIAGGLKRISDPSIEERIRVAIGHQAALGA